MPIPGNLDDQRFLFSLYHRIFHYMFTARQISTAILAAITSFSAYTAIFTFRKAFNVAAYDGYTLFGMDYKVVLVITQVLGYMASKFYGICRYQRSTADQCPGAEQQRAVC